MSDIKCRCGAYAKPELRRRGTNDLVCSWCYDQSWEGHGAEWEDSFKETYDER